MRWIFLLLLMGNLLLLVLIFQAGKEQETVGGQSPVGELDVMPITDYEQLGRNFQQDKTRTEPGVTTSRSRSGSQPCSTLGPLPTRLQARELSTELASLGLASSIRSDIIKTIRDYWVIQTPAVTAEHQESDIARVRRSGITDISAIRDGVYKGGISLGIYRNRANAIKRRQQVDRFGLTAEIIERGDEESVFWVNTNTDVRESLDSGVIDSITSRYIPITIEPVDCL